jgi:hypothetical protein
VFALPFCPEQADCPAVLFATSPQPVFPSEKWFYLGLYPSEVLVLSCVERGGRRYHCIFQAFVPPLAAYDKELVNGRFRMSSKAVIHGLVGYQALRGSSGVIKYAVPRVQVVMSS